MGKTVIQRHKKLIRKLNNLRDEEMYIGVDLEGEISSRKNLIRSYSIICNEIYNGKRSGFDLDELKMVIENKKLKIAEHLNKKIENKKKIRKIHNQLSNLL